MTSGTLTISAHDFRSLRKASVHFITQELARRGPARFASIGLSPLALRRGDPRASLAEKAGRVEVLDGVECFLWKTPVHPFRVRRKGLDWVEPLMFEAYGRLFPPLLRRWIAEAEIVLLESGIAAAYAGAVRRINPRARLIYLASDDLGVIGAAPSVARRFRRDYDLFETVRLPSRHLAPEMPHLRNAALIPHGIDSSMAERQYDDPYAGDDACVSVGSMLFDPWFFEVAAPRFPDLQFHIIGAGRAAEGLSAPNIVVWPEMAFERTLAYLRHARFGVAPYRDSDTPAYLIDTSLKLRQFALFGLPSVCPTFACGGLQHRYGYVPADEASVVHAVESALAHTATVFEPSLSWPDVVDRLLQPRQFADTLLA